MPRSHQSEHSVGSFDAFSLRYSTETHPMDFTVPKHGLVNIARLSLHSLKACFFCFSASMEEVMNKNSLQLSVYSVVVLSIGDDVLASSQAYP